MSATGPLSRCQIIVNNTRGIRDALYDRLSDPDCGVRAEAVLGLAVRGDQRVVEPLIGELKGSNMADGYHNYCGSQIIDAAAQIAGPRLYPHLVSLRGTYPEENLEEALESCRPPVSQT